MMDNLETLPFDIDTAIEAAAAEKEIRSCCFATAFLDQLMFQDCHSNLSIYLSIYLSIHLSIYLSIHLSLCKYIYICIYI